MVATNHLASCFLARLIVALGLAFGCASPVAFAQTVPAEVEDAKEEDLALKLQNPVADLISVPFQSNYDGRIGPGGNGNRFTLNIQPVIPVELNNDWNLISRTITPIISQWDIAPNSGSQSGLGDIVQSLFLSPAKPTDNGVIWGVGPVFLLPTGTRNLLPAHQFGVGPTAVVLKQAGGWTTGILANHLWSAVETTSNATRVSATFFQPFVSYTTKDLWTFTLNTEFDLQLAERQNFCSDQRDGLQTSGGRQAAHQPLPWPPLLCCKPSNGPKGFGARASVVFLFPK